MFHVKHFMKNMSVWISAVLRAFPAAEAAWYWESSCIPVSYTHLTGEICFTDENPCKILRRLKKEEGKSIWICGGADVIRQLMEEDLIDEYDISVIPVILGDGIRLFGKRESPVRLRLVRSGGRDGIVELVYVREKE